MEDEINEVFVLHYVDLCESDTGHTTYYRTVIAGVYRTSEAAQAASAGGSTYLRVTPAKLQ